MRILILLLAAASLGACSVARPLSSPSTVGADAKSPRVYQVPGSFDQEAIAAAQDVIGRMALGGPRVEISEIDGMPVLVPDSAAVAPMPTVTMPGFVPDMPVSPGVPGEARTFRFRAPSQPSMPIVPGRPGQRWYFSYPDSTGAVLRIDTIAAPRVEPGKKK